jgi:hypothetical protein
MDRHARRKSSEPPDPASLPGPIEESPPKGAQQQPRMLDVATLRSNPVLRPLVERATAMQKRQREKS